MSERKHTMKRVSTDLVSRLEKYRESLRKQYSKDVSFVEASRQFAQNSVVNTDSFDDGIRRIGKKWYFRP